MLNGRIADQSGNPAPEALHQQGPLVQVVVSLSDDRADALNAKGEKVPDSQSGFGLIDTGATNTAIDRYVAQNAGLTTVGSAKSISALNTETVPVYAGKIVVQPRSLGSKKGWVTMDLNAMQGLNLQPLSQSGQPNIIALIGRDLLSRCLFVYNGPNAHFSLSL